MALASGGVGVAAPFAATFRNKAICDQRGWCTGQQLRTGRYVSRKRSGHMGVVAEKQAHLRVRKERVVQLPEWVTSAEPCHSLSSFLRHPEGMQSMLNTKSLRKMEPLGNNVYRCTLPPLEFLDFEVAPIFDLYVASSHNECSVEMLSCKFEGSEEVERQNKRFSGIPPASTCPLFVALLTHFSHDKPTGTFAASMKNQLTWDCSTRLNVDIELKLSLEIYTFPFTHLPSSAVEVPGNTILQACVDRMLPAFVDYLLDDYKRWLRLQEQQQTFTGASLDT